MNILLIEDELTAARRLTKMIAELVPESTVLAHLDSVESSIAWLEQHPAPDLIFMDIQLADGESFEIFEHVEVNAPVVFTTAYDRYAIEAFRVDAIGYLLKPIKTDELRAALEKYHRKQEARQIDYRKLAAKLRREEYDRRFLIRMGQSIKMVDVREAAYFYSEHKITFLMTKSGKRYPIDPSLEALEELLDPGRFFRANRQFIVSLEAISEMIAYSKARVKIVLDPPIEETPVVSTERSPIFKKWLTGD